MIKRFTTFFFLFLLAAPCFAALSANTVWEVRTGGSDTNGGGFVTGASGSDHTLQDAAQYSVTDGVTNGTTTITSATANFGTDVVGNIMYVQGGTGSVVAGWYQITVRNSSSSVTVDRSTGLTAGTGVTLKIGGALATPGNAAALATVSGHDIHVKSGTYTMSTATPGAGGPVLFGSSIRVSMRGYQTTRNDNTGTRPILSWGAVGAPGGTTYLFSGQGTAAQTFINMQADGNGVANVSGFTIANARYSAINCKAVNCNQASQVGFLGSASTARGIISCSAVSCTIGFSNGSFYKSTADTCGTGFSATSASTLHDCIAWDCTADGFTATTNGASMVGCVAFSNDGDGFDSGTATWSLINCVSVSNGGYGFNGTSSQSFLLNCATYNNTSGRSPGVSGLHADLGAITLSGDPFVDSSSDDFRPDNTASEGALLRAAAYDVYGQTDSRDVGAVQHTDPAGGGSLVNGGLAN